MNLSELSSSASLISAEILLSVAGVVLMVIAPVLKNVREERRSLFFCGFALAGFVSAFALNAARFEGSHTAFSGALLVDSFSSFFNSIFIVNAFVVTFLARKYLSDSERLGEFLALVSFCTVGMMLMAELVEFVSLFIAFETMSICVYALSGFSRKTFSSAEAGIKYLITGGFSSALMLLGIALLYGASGSVVFDDIGAALLQNPSNPMLITGAALVLSGFIFKIGAAPLHQWVPDVYHGAPMPATAFMSVGVKVAAFAILARFAASIGTFGEWALPSIITAVAIVTMSVGNVSAIAQKSVKRMLAYSSIAHAGYGIVGVAAYLSGGSYAGLSGLFYYMLAYAIMSLGAFGILSLLGKDGEEADGFSDIAGLWRTNPAIAVSLAVFMFSLAGIPPTAGFFAKYRVFLPAAQEGMYWLVLFALVNSVVSAYYYLKVLVFAFMRPVTRQQTAMWKPGLGAQAVIAALCIGTLVLGIFPMRTAEMAEFAARTLTLK